MSVKTVRYALGLLQDQPDNREALAELHRAVGFHEESAPVSSPDLGAEVLGLIESARRGHERRREIEAAFRLLQVETALRADRGAAFADLLRFAEFELLDDREVLRIADQALASDPTHQAALGARARADERGATWSQTATALVSEADKESDAGLRAALYARAADLAFRYAKPGDEAAPASIAGGKKKRKKKSSESADAPPVSLRGGELPLLGWLETALAADPSNRAALQLYLRTLRLQLRWDDLDGALARAAEHATTKEERVQYLLQRARILRRNLARVEDAIGVYEEVLDRMPGQHEAISALVDAYTEREMWDHLVTLYEEQLRSGLVATGEELGLLVQVAMIRWRMQQKLDQAVVAFDKVRRLAPTHAGMLQFFREYTQERGERARMTEVLNDAYRALPDGPERAQVGAELAALAEESENAQRAIEQYRAVLRQEPQNQAARDGLRRLYRQTGAMNALIDLLRGELDRTPAEAEAERARVLREIADVYRNHTKSDSALVSVLSQLSQLVSNDKDVLRELSAVYERLGRHRDVLLVQDKLAALEEDPEVRAEIYRVVARKWLEQFTNVQNAIETYEKLREVVPADHEARDRLRELYTKRRAYRPLGELLRQEIELTRDPEEQCGLLHELARLSAERLDQGAEAIALYKRLVEHHPDDTQALDALEKYAEREKDFATVAEVLERRATDTGEAGTAALLKLGAIYTERVANPDRARAAWLRVLERQPSNPKALRVLRDLLLATRDYDELETAYARAGDIDGLLDVFSTAADRTADPEQKIELSIRVADLCEGRLNAPERAFRAYERILAVKPGDLRAARALIPLYEDDGRHAKAVPLYEVLVQAAATPAEKIELYERLQRVAERELKDGELAMHYARLAYEQEPSAARLDALEAVANQTGGFVHFASAIEERIRDGKTPAAERRALRKRLAELARARGRVEDALAAYQALLEEEADDEEVILRLDGLLREVGKHDELRELYDRRVAQANTARKAKLLEEWADLEENGWGAEAEAVRVYERLLEVIPGHGGALRALSRLYTVLGDGEGALRVLERDRDGCEDAHERARLEVEIAKVLEGRLNRPARALDALKRALESAPGDAAAIEVLERLLPRPETRVEAATILEQHYDQSNDLDKQASVLEVSIATRASKTDRVPLFRKLAEVQERRNQPDLAFEVIARALEDEASDVELWETYERLARRTRRMPECGERLAHTLSNALALPEASRASLLRMAARVFEDELGDVARALPYLEALHTREPEDRGVFERLKQILSTREEWAQLSKLYDAQIEREQDPATRIGLLEDAAIVAEEMRSDPALAAQYFERILSEDITHEQAARSLETLYREQGQHAELARVLSLRLEHGTGADPSELRLDLARLYLGPLDDKRKAATLLDEVLTEDPLMHDARLLLEELLGDASQRADVARILERVHDARDDARALTQMLEIRLETASPEEEEALLRRIAELRDERLTDDAGAFEAYGKLLPRVPDDEEVRERLLVIGRRLGNLRGLTQVLEEALTAEAANTQKARLAFELGQLHRELGEGIQAAAAFERVRTASPDDALLADALRELDSLYTAQDDTEALRSVLEAASAHVDFSAERGAIQRRLGVLARDRQNDVARALSAFESALGEDEADLEALAALTPLYESAGAFDKLAENLQRREQLAEDADERRALAVSLAHVQADKLGHVDEAIDQFRAVLGDFGGDDAIFVKLAALYPLVERWEDLAAVHEERARYTENMGVRVRELLAAGHVRKDKLEDSEGALALCREALSIEPDDVAARDAVLALTHDEGVGAEAAEMLLPLYEASGDRRQLLELLRVQIDRAEDLDEKLHKLERAIEIAEGYDDDAALRLAAEAVRLAQDEPSYPAYAARLERLALARGAYEHLASVYREVIANTVDEERKFELLLRVGQLEGERLERGAEDPTRLREARRAAYEAAREMRPDDDAVLVPLYHVLRSERDFAALAPLLAHRAELAEDPSARRRLLVELAELQRGELRDVSAATDTFEAVLDLGFDAQTAEHLVALYTDQQRFGDLVSLYERELGEDGTSRERRATLQNALGGLFVGPIADADRALDAYEAALALEPSHPAPRAALERFLEDPQHTERAAEALEPVYVQQHDWLKLGAALEARVRAAEEPAPRIELLTRLAKLREEQEEDYAGALAAMGRVLVEDPRERSLWTELERLARVAGAESRLAEMWSVELEKVPAEEYDDDLAALAEKTGALYNQLGDPERALIYYRRSLEFAPEAADSSFQAMDEIYTHHRRWEERAALYRSALAYREEPETRLRTLHVLAAMEEHELRQPERAVETFRQCLEVDAEDRSALDALERLLAELGRWSELADLLERISEDSQDPRREARVRLELGRVLHERLERTDEAIDHYERVLELFSLDGPGQDAARALIMMLPDDGVDAFDRDRAGRVLEILDPAYQRADAWQARIELARVREHVASDVTERVLILRERAKLQHERAGDREAAFMTLREAFVLDPADGELRAELDALAALDQRWDDLAGAYEAALVTLDDELAHRELLLALARLHDERRDDPRAALDAYTRLLAGEEADPDLLAKASELATLLSDWSALVSVLRKKADAAIADDERASLLRQVGEIQRDMLERPDAAIEAYERALEIEQDSAFTVDQLIDLYSARKEPERLVALYRQRIELTEEERSSTDPEDLPALDRAIHELSCAAAQVYEGPLGDRPAAIDLYRRADELATALEIPRVPVLKKLEALYVAESMSADLLENLARQRELCESADEARALLRRIAAIQEQEGDAALATQSYRALIEERFEPELATRVLTLAEAHEELRAPAADLLEAHLRAADLHTDLVRALGWRAAAEEDPARKAEAVFAVAEVEERGLGDAAAALTTLLAALPIAPAHRGLHERLARLTELVAGDAHARYADAIAKENDNQFDAAVGTYLSELEAQIAERQLSDPTRAARSLRRALEQGGDDERLLGELARLSRILDRRDDVAEALERRVELLHDPAAIAAVYAELGDLFADEDVGRALASYRAALERVPQHAASRQGLQRLLDHDSHFEDVFETLEALAREVNDLDALVALHERRIQRTADRAERLSARLALAEAMAAEPTRAQRVLEDALLEDPSDESVQTALESTVAQTGEKAAALAAFARALAADPSTQADLSDDRRSALWQQLGARARAEIEDLALAERAFDHANQLTPHNRDILGQLIELRAGVGREQDRFVALRDRARAPGEATAQQDDYRAAFALIEADPAAAEALLREALVAHDGWLFAIDELAKIKANTTEGAELLLRRAALSDATEAREHRLGAAQAFEAAGEIPRAIELYAELAKDAPLHGVAPERLRVLYTQTGDDRALDALLCAQIEVAEREPQIALRMDLAQLRLDPSPKWSGGAKVVDSSGAVAPLTAILEVDPHHGQAVLLLAKVYEDLGRHEELAALLERELITLIEQSETYGALRLLTRLGALYEEHLADPGRALRAYARVLDLGGGPTLEEREPALQHAARLAHSREEWAIAARALDALVSNASSEQAAELAEQLATTRVKLGEVDAAVTALRLAVSAVPDRASSRRQLAELLRTNARWDELATALVEEAELVRTRAGAAIPATGSIPPREGPVVSVLALYREAASIHTEQRGAPADAATVLERASTAVPDNRELLLELCDAYVASGRPREATAVLERIIQSFGGKRSKELAIYHHRLGKALAELGDRERALSELDMAFKIDPGNVRVLRDLGAFALDSGDLERAQKTFRALLIQKLDPSSGLTKAEVFEYLGEIAERQNDKARAIESYKRALDNDPNREKAKAKLAELK